MIFAKLRAAREAKGFSQEYMAAKLQIAQASYSRLESGIAKLDVWKIITIADVLELDPISIIDEELRLLKKVL